MQAAHKVFKEIVSVWAEGDRDSAQYKRAIEPSTFCE